MKDNIIIGKTIKGMKIADDKLALLFETEDGDVLVEVDAECCSFTWIEHVELPALGFPATVISVDDLTMPNEDGFTDEDEYEYIRYYGCKVSTTKGDIIIDYRNSSNGYYGGDLSWPNNEYRYGGVYGQANSEFNWVNLDKDI